MKSLFTEAGSCRVLSASALIRFFVFACSAPQDNTGKHWNCSSVSKFDVTYFVCFRLIASLTAFCVVVFALDGDNSCTTVMSQYIAPVAQYITKSGPDRCIAAPLHNLECSVLFSSEMTDEHDEHTKEENSLGSRAHNNNNNVPLCS